MIFYGLSRPGSVSAPIVKWIEHQPSKLDMQVRFLLGAPRDQFRGGHGIMVITSACGAENTGSIPVGHP